MVFLVLTCKIERTAKISRLCRRTACFLFALMCLNVLCFAQQPQPETTFKVRSSLVLIDVITRDGKNGLPVRDLTKEDFQVFDNGHPVPIDTFDTGTHFDTRSVTLWLVVICNEQGNEARGSGLFHGRAALLRPALDQLDSKDRVGVAHWCDNGDVGLDLPPTDDRNPATKKIEEVLEPIPFFTTVPSASRVGELSAQKMIRLIIQDAHHRSPQPLPVVVFLHGDYTGMPKQELDLLVDDFLETSGIVFGIRDSSSPLVPDLLYEQGSIFHYMAAQTGGEYLSVPPARYADALESIIVQLHFRYVLGFKPLALDGKRHKLTVKLTNRGGAERKSVRIRYRPEYIPIPDEPSWMH
jgi:hypothetical protein